MVEYATKSQIDEQIPNKAGTGYDWRRRPAAPRLPVLRRTALHPDNAGHRAAAIGLQLLPFAQRGLAVNRSDKARSCPRAASSYACGFARASRMPL